MAVINTYRTKEDGFLIILIEFEDKNRYLAFLCDPWKTGLRDYDEHKGSLKSLKRNLGAPRLKFHEISKSEAAMLLRQNYDIASALDVELEEKMLNWLDKLGVLKIERQGTLYSCFNCEEGDLSEEVIKEIQAIARRELADEVIGTEEEEQYFKICKSCEDELHQQHENQSHHHH